MKKRIIINSMESAYNEESVKAHCASKIKELRLRINMSQEEFAHLLGVSPSSYKKYEAGKVLQPTDFLWKLSEFAGEPIDYFVREINDEEKCWANIVSVGNKGMFRILSRLVAYFGADRFQELVEAFYRED